MWFIRWDTSLNLHRKNAVVYYTVGNDIRLSFVLRSLHPPLQHCSVRVLWRKSCGCSAEWRQTRIDGYRMQPAHCYPIWISVFDSGQITGLHAEDWENSFGSVRYSVKWTWHKFLLLTFPIRARWKSNLLPLLVDLSHKAAWKFALFARSRYANFASQ